MLELKNSRTDQPSLHDVVTAPPFAKRLCSEWASLEMHNGRCTPVVASSMFAKRLHDESACGNGRRSSRHSKDTRSSVTACLLARLAARRANILSAVRQLC